jgi:hypothetical protein
MIIPTRHQFKMIAGAAFDFRFVYLLGPPSSQVPIDLSEYLATWTITSLDGLTMYASYTGPSQPSSSGVFFGGSTNDPTTGIIDLIITAEDSTTQSWTQANYMLSVTPPDQQTVPLMQGTIIVTAALS